eukprot:TRINITY_DN6640_c0_g4_i4.p1 TRINITY_DN6640_c0_g4~~TRINITY_DN6640_c0_g4_i4.p1  ORF type:complete len:443 (-),score=92.38 TRINITY_DN6640_c0_g4_i4:57-1304(-)
MATDCQVANHVMCVEFHFYLYQLIERIPLYELHKLPNPDYDLEEAREPITLTICQKENMRISTFENTMPKRYTDCLDFYLFDLDPVFYPGDGPHTHSPNGLILKNIFLQTTGIPAHPEPLSFMYPEMLLSVELDDIVWIEWQLPERDRRYRIDFSSCPSWIDYRSLSTMEDDLKWTQGQPIITETSVDLRPCCSPVFNQGDLGTCGIATAVSLFEMVLGRRLSVLFLYYTTRVEVARQYPHYDFGSEAHLVQDAIRRFGVCLSSTWPYDARKFSTRPPDHAWEEAKKNLELHADEIVSLHSFDEMKACLREGRPFNVDGNLCGDAYSRRVAATGLVPLPRPNEVISRTTNEHSLMVVGYDDEKQVLIFQNSWGKTWGDGGFGYLPYHYFNLGLWRDAYTYIPRGQQTSLSRPASN